MNTTDTPFPAPIHRKPVAALLTGLLFLFPVSSLFAQEEDEEVIDLSPFEVSAEDSVGYYATNAFSATKTKVPIQDLPMNIQVMTREFIEDVDAITLEDVVKYSATLTPSTNEPGRFSMRGFVQPTPMRNGMDTLGETNFYGTGTVERIEVVKGPSAILYGITEPGGLVNVITKKPQFNFFGSLGAQVGELSTYRFDVDVTGPVEFGEGDPFAAYRIIGVFDNVGYDMPFAEDETRLIAPSVKFRFTENTTLLAAVEYQELRSIQRGSTIIKVGTEEDGDREGERIGFIQGNYYGLSRYYNHEGPDSHKDVDTRFASLDFQHRFMNDQFVFRAVLNHTDNYIDQDIRSQYGLERTGPDGELGWVRTGFLARFVDREELTFQAELAGEFETGPVGHNFVVGYEDTDFEQAQVAWRENNVLPLIDLKDPSTWNFDITIPPLERSVNPADFVRYQDTWSAYAVHQASMVDDRLHTLLGLRYDVVNASTFDRKSGMASDEPKTTNTTPQAGVLFDVTESIGVFASYSESFSPNVQVNPDGGTFDPATGEGYDIGIKFNSADNRFNATISVFEIEKTNIVRRDSEKSEELEGLWFNTSGLEKSEGWEIDIVMTPIDNYQLTFSYAYVDAYIVSNTDDPELEGRQIRDSPNHSYSFWNKYTFDEGGMAGIYVGAGVVSRDNAEIAENLVNRFVSYPSYVVIDATVGYRTKIGDLDWDFSVKVFNLTDEWYMDRQRRVANGRNFQFYAKVKF